MLTSSILEKLAKAEGFPKVSIYFPTHRTYPEYEQDSIRLGNGLKDASRQLAGAGLSRDEIDNLLGTALDRANDALFWKFQDEGLAVFIEDRETQWVKLPGQPAEINVVAHRYHVRPLIRLLRETALYYVLAVSQGKPELLAESSEGLREVNVADMPDGVEAIKGRTKFEANVGYHARDRGAQTGGTHAPKYAALGESPEDYKDVLLDHYCHDVAKAVDAALASIRAPLIVAALPRTAGRLKRHLTHPDLVSEAVTVDPQGLSREELRARARSLLAPILSREAAALHERLHAASAGADVPHARNLEKIIQAATEGRVETLFLADDIAVWGHFDPVHRVIRVDKSAGPENEDLLNLAALHTLATGGDVRTLPDDVPGPTAALYRY